MGGAVSGQSVLRAFRNFSPGISMGTVPIAIPVEKFLNRPFSGTKLEVPRLATPRGRARGRARAIMQSLS